VVRGSIRREIEMRLESIARCYEIERAKETQMPGARRLGGRVTLRLNGLRNTQDVVSSDDLGNEFVLACAVDAMAEVVGSSPYLGLPSSEAAVVGSSPYLGLPSNAVAVVLKFVKTDADTQRPRWWLHQL
jgi:hypothetical protein